MPWGLLKSIKLKSIKLKSIKLKSIKLKIYQANSIYGIAKSSVRYNTKEVRKREC